MSLTALRRDRSPDENCADSRQDQSTAECRAAEQRMEHLYRAQGTWLTRFFARRNGGNDTPDLVQESFLRLAELGPRGLDRLKRPEAYLTQVARNLLRNRAKSAAHRAAALNIPAEVVPLVGADVEAQLEARDMLDRLEAAMLRLPPKTREIFMAHRLDGLTYPEIAARMGMSVKGVEKQISRALADLRHWLGPL